MRDTRINTHVYNEGYAHAWIRTRKDKDEVMDARRRGPGLTMNGGHCSKDGGALLHPDREASQGLIEPL